MTHSPLIGPPPPEVPLPDAPLVRVIAQVRFPLIAALGRRDFIAPFQEAVRQDYAVLREVPAARVEVRGEGGPSVQLQAGTRWQLQDLSHDWRVTLDAGFLALETTRYTSREDFFGRFARLTAALGEHVRPGAMDRIGVRYVDRLVGDALGRLSDLARPPLLGVLGVASTMGAKVAVSEALFELPEEDGELRARWGLVPAQATFDANAVEAIDEPSWVLDLDAFSQGERPYDAAKINTLARALAARAYSFFRWSVTDEFLRHFGGSP